MPPDCYTFLSEPRGDLYRSLLRHDSSERRTALLVVQKGMTLSASGQQVLSRLAPFVHRQEVSSHWPGTELLRGRQATVYHFDLTAESADLLSEVVDGLFEWLQPELPEDLCILRSDGSPWLTSISHENDAWLELGSLEHEALSPELKQILVKDPPGGPRRKESESD
jgi:hypothetical protein